MRQQMPENGRISGTSQVYLFLREKETRDSSTREMFRLSALGLLHSCHQFFTGVTA